MVQDQTASQIQVHFSLKVELSSTLPLWPCKHTVAIASDGLQTVLALQVQMTEAYQAYFELFLVCLHLFGRLV